MTEFALKSASLDAVIQGGGLRPFFQPILDTRSGDIFGYEALIRGPVCTDLATPAALFQAAAEQDRLLELDWAARRACIQRFASLDLPGLLFINVMPQSLLDPTFQQGLTLHFLHEYGVSPHRVIIELTEQHPIHDYTLLGEAVAHYRRMGFRVALDDLGTGYSGLRHWSELKPDFVKIDRHFVQQIDHDAGKRRFMEWLQEVAADLDCQVIAEGVETQGEYDCLWARNWRLMQGFFFARPSAVPPRKLDCAAGSNRRHTSPPRGTVASLSRRCATVAAETPMAEVAQLLRCAEQPPRTIAVTEGPEPIGLIRTSRFLSRFANPYAHSLYGRRPARAFADPETRFVQEDTSLEDLSRQLTECNETIEEDFIIVDTAGRYAGTASAIDLLREITNLQLRNARHANPLTDLPGNVPIKEELARRLATERAFVVVHCDIDAFKAFNDYYGYAQGDQLIQALAETLRQQLHERDDFLGHIGGDDFLMILGPESWQAKCESVLARFAWLAPEHYDAHARGRGGIESIDRQQRRRFFPICSLSLAVLPVTAAHYSQPHEISDTLAELKAQAKRQPGNSLFVERRTAAE